MESKYFPQGTRNWPSSVRRDFTALSAIIHLRTKISTGWSSASWRSIEGGNKTIDGFCALRVYIWERGRSNLACTLC